jgi:hypothetical protein
MAKFLQPKSLAAFLGDEEESTNSSGGLKWSGIVGELGEEAFNSPPRQENTPNSISKTAVDIEAEQQLQFFNNLPSSKHLFFLDKLRAPEHFFQVHFESGSATTAYFAFNSSTKRLRRVVSQERVTLSHSVFRNKDEGKEGMKKIETFRKKLAQHLEEKHYPKTSSIIHLGNGRMCTLGELYIHPNREDLIQEIQETKPDNILDALDQSLMLDVLSISVEEGESSSNDGLRSTTTTMEGKDRPCSIAAIVLLFDEKWYCCNHEGIINGIIEPEVGALALHQTLVSSQHLWISPQVPLQQSNPPSHKEEKNSADPGDDIDSFISSSLILNSRSQDSTVCTTDCNDGRLVDKNEYFNQYLINVLNVARLTLKERN